MTEPMRGAPALSPEEIAWSGVATSFAAFGRVFLCLDRGFRIVHASYVLDELAGAGTAAAVAEAAGTLVTVASELVKKSLPKG